MDASADRITEGFSGSENENVLMSLPTALIHGILSEWIDVHSVIRLDVASCGNKEFHTQLLYIFESNVFFLKEVKPFLRGNTHRYSQMLTWLLLRQIKVRDFELTAQCCRVAWDSYLQRFGEHIRHVCTAEEFLYENRHGASQSAIIGNHCKNLFSFYCSTSGLYNMDNLLCVLSNNLSLEKLHISGWLWGIAEIKLCRVRQLKWGLTASRDLSLTSFLTIVPNLKQLVLYRNPYILSQIHGPLTVPAFDTCPGLRSLGCADLYLGTNDSCLKQWLSLCPDIVNLDLGGHDLLTDAVLTDALSELRSLFSLNLQGCKQLTDRTLRFLAQRFASTLNVLYLESYVVQPQHRVNADDDTITLKQMQKQKGGYTAAGIESLRAQCTHLHTFHLVLDTGLPPRRESVEDYRHATIVEVRWKDEEIYDMILERCPHMQIVVIHAFDVWWTVEQVMALAERSPQLRLVVLMESAYETYNNRGDCTAVRKAFPKLRFTSDKTEADFDVLSMPI